MSRKQLKIDFSVVSCIGLMTFMAVTGLILASSKASAEDSATTNASVTVPVACSMAGHTDTAHNASLIPGTYSGASGSEYEQGIGKTTLTTFCNDNNGFSIYAVGFTGDTMEGENHTKLVGTSASGNATIPTKVYESSDTTSNWSMKVTKVENPSQGDPVTYNPQNMNIANSFNSWHTIPDTYTKVAEYHATTGSSTTDTALGAKVETTYATYISTTQPADTYTGKVKYTMVHPYNEEPLQPQTPTAGCINYFANASDAVGTMGCQTISDYAKDWSQCVNGTDYSSYCYNSDFSNIISSLPSTNNASITLLASNFSREGYGFAGWSDKFDYATNSEAKFYGPQETITVPTGTTANGLSLYAVWIKSQGSIQDQSKVASVCNSLTIAPTNGTANLDSVSALTDQRDNNTYAIAKLADGKCWMIENLRLDNTVEHNTDGTLAQGYHSSFAGLANAESARFSNYTTANGLYSTDGSTTKTIDSTGGNLGYRFPRYNNLNTLNRAQNKPNSNTFTDNNTTPGMYSYGNYYTWHAAIADTTHNGSNNTSSDTTSICPKGWRLPHGGQTTVNTTAEFYLLGKAIMNNIEPDQNASNGYGNYGNSVTNTAGKTASAAFRSYPNNFLYPGIFNGSSAFNRGSIGYYWSSTAYDSNYSYILYLYSSKVTPGSDYDYKFFGSSIRCVSSS